MSAETQRASLDVSTAPLITIANRRRHIGTDGYYCSQPLPRGNRYRISRAADHEAGGALLRQARAAEQRVAAQAAERSAQELAPAPPSTAAEAVRDAVRAARTRLRTPNIPTAPTSDQPPSAGAAATPPRRWPPNTPRTRRRPRPLRPTPTTARRSAPSSSTKPRRGTASI